MEKAIIKCDEVVSNETSNYIKQKWGKLDLDSVLLSDVVSVIESSEDAEKLVAFLNYIDKELLETSPDVETARDNMERLFIDFRNYKLYGHHYSSDDTKPGDRITSEYSEPSDHPRHKGYRSCMATKLHPDSVNNYDREKN